MARNIILKIRLLLESYKLEEEVEKTLRGKGVGDVTVDLDGVGFLLSSSIAQIIKLYKKCKVSGTVFRVVNAGKCGEMFRTLRLDGLFEVTD